MSRNEIFNYLKESMVGRISKTKINTDDVDGMICNYKEMLISIFEDFLKKKKFYQKGDERGLKLASSCNSSEEPEYCWLDYPEFFEIEIEYLGTKTAIKSIYYFPNENEKILIEPYHFSLRSLEFGRLKKETQKEIYTTIIDFEDKPIKKYSIDSEENIIL